MKFINVYNLSDTEFEKVSKEYGRCKNLISKLLLKNRQFISKKYEQPFDEIPPYQLSIDEYVSCFRDIGLSKKGKIGSTLEYTISDCIETWKEDVIFAILNEYDVPEENKLWIKKSLN
ncbi:MAG: hypothetical protein M0R03_22545 [Novosphingobium sp.]|nr:hypothetical protein [Novosphingobium sp.]